MRQSLSLAGTRTEGGALSRANELRESGGDMRISGDDGARAESGGRADSGPRVEVGLRESGGGGTESSGADGARADSDLRVEGGLRESGGGGGTRRSADGDSGPREDGGLLVIAQNRPVTVPPR